MQEKVLSYTTTYAHLSLTLHYREKNFKIEIMMRNVGERKQNGVTKKHFLEKVLGNIINVLYKETGQTGILVLQVQNDVLTIYT